MAENELEVRLLKKIKELQSQINTGNVYLKRVHGQVTHPSILARIKSYTDAPIALLTARIAAWVDYSVTSTIVGWSAFTTKALEYKLIDDIIFISFHLSGTSDSTTLTFTLPYQAQAARKIKCLDCIDDGMQRAVNGIVSLSASSDIVTCTLDGDATAWTNANQKTIQGQFFYRIV